MSDTDPPYKMMMAIPIRTYFSLPGSDALGNGDIHAVDTQPNSTD